MMMTSQAQVENESRRLLAVLAHPDDESFGIGGTLAHYAAQGVDVHLVTATGGDAGVIVDGGLQGFGSLAERRLAELGCAAEALGLASVNLLGYRDSGMAGSPDNQHPNALVNATIDEAARKIICHIRRLRPQVVVTHDPIGGYRHPDHIAVHQAAVRAFFLAGDAELRDEDGLPPFQPEKLFYVVMPRTMLRLMMRVWRLLGRDTRHFGQNGDIDLESIAAVDFPRHAVVDYRTVYRARQRASACHASQGGPSITGGIVGLLGRIFTPYDTFTQAHPPFEGEAPLKDLFAGLETG